VAKVAAEAKAIEDAKLAAEAKAKAEEEAKNAEEPVKSLKDVLFNFVEEGLPELEKFE